MPSSAPGIYASKGGCFINHHHQEGFERLNKSSAFTDLVACQVTDFTAAVLDFIFAWSYRMLL